MTKRRVIQVVVFLLLGAIVNVAVAWGLIYRSTKVDSVIAIQNNIFPVQYRHNYGKGGSGPNSTYDLADNVRITSLAQSVQLAQQCLGLQHDGANLQSACQCRVVAGWPAFSMTTNWRPYAEFADIHLKPRMWLMQHTRFPIWPGFAINTIFYAAVLWMLFAIPGVPFVMRRRRRIKRGLCPACAYPVGASPVCTECGNSLPSRSVRSQ